MKEGRVKYNKKLKQTSVLSMTLKLRPVSSDTVTVFQSSEVLEKLPAVWASACAE